MAAIVWGATLVGVEAWPVAVEVDLLRRLPCVVMVGLLAPSVRESVERVRSAILAAGEEFPRARVVVSLAPADLRKDGTGFDLPVAVGILAAAAQVDATEAARWVFHGELALDGTVRPVRGALAVASLAQARGCRGVVVAEANGAEAALVEGIEVRTARTLAEVVSFLRGGAALPGVVRGLPAAPAGVPDLADVRGQPLARRALEVAAAGGHNLLLEGPPGCGKTMLAARLPGILPPMTPGEALACTRIHGVAGTLGASGGVLASRPFRAPHHSVSPAGLLGGAALLPGEVSLAHHGVLFLDEFPEFPRHAREALRGPLEDRRVLLARAGGHVELPASFLLVAAANPCPCGWAGHPTRPCVCGPVQRARYRARLSGPIVDRIDLRVGLSPVAASDLLAPAEGEGSAEVRARVCAARVRQSARYGGRVLHNAELSAEEVLAAADARPEALACLREHLDRARASARVGRRLLKVARTLADLEGARRVERGHVRDALSLRLDPPDDAEIA